MYELLGALRAVPLGVSHKTRAIGDESDQQRCDPLSGTGEDLTRALVEVQVHQLQDVFDFVAPDLTLGDWRASPEDLIGTAALRSLAGQTVGLQVAPDAGIGGTQDRRIGRGQHDPQVVVEEFDVPRGVLSILLPQRFGRLERDTGEGAVSLRIWLRNTSIGLVAVLAA